MKRGGPPGGVGLAQGMGRGGPPGGRQRPRGMPMNRFAAAPINMMGGNEPPKPAP